MKVDYRELLEKIKDFFRKTKKTNWGKRQILEKLIEMENSYYLKKLGIK